MTAFHDNLMSFSSANKLNPETFSQLCNFGPTSMRNTLSKPDTVPQKSRLKVLAKVMGVSESDLLKKKIQFKPSAEIAKRVAEMSERKKRGRHLRSRGVGRTSLPKSSLATSSANGRIDPQILALALRKCGYDQGDAAERIAKVYEQIAAI